MCGCVYAHTHTHCTDGVLECEPRGRKRHLEGLKNPEELNLGIDVFRICVQGRHGKWKGVVMWTIEGVKVWHARKGAE